MATIVPVIVELFDLCGLVQEIDGLDQKLAALPARRATIESRLAAPRERVAQLEKQLAQARDTERAIERRLKELRQQQDRYRAQLESVASVRESESLQHQIDRLRAEAAQAEDEGLAALTVWEEAERDLPEASAAVKRADEDAARQLAQCAEDEEKLKAARAMAKSEMDARHKGLSDETAALWEPLSHRYGADALAPVTHQGVCSGCDMSLMPAFRSNAMMMREIVRCPTCGRILYDPERLESEGKRSLAKKSR